MGYDGKSFDDVYHDITADTCKLDFLNPFRFMPVLVPVMQVRQGSVLRAAIPCFSWVWAAP